MTVGCCACRGCTSRVGRQVEANDSIVRIDLLALTSAEHRAARADNRAGAILADCWICEATKHVNGTCLLAERAETLRRVPFAQLLHFSVLHQCRRRAICWRTADSTTRVANSRRRRIASHVAVPHGPHVRCRHKVCPGGVGSVGLACVGLCVGFRFNPWVGEEGVAISSSMGEIESQPSLRFWTG